MQALQGVVDGIARESAGGLNPKDQFAFYLNAYNAWILHEALGKYPGKSFDEIEDSIALDYEKHGPGSALPWDHARQASRAAWTKVSGVVTPRDVTRGMRDSI